MIRLHDGVAINSINVAAMFANREGVCFMLVTGRFHKVEVDPDVVAAAFKYWRDILGKEINLLEVSPGRAINTDAIASMAKVTSGVAFNMLGSHTEYFNAEGEAKDAAFETLFATINKLEKEAA